MSETSWCVACLVFYTSIRALHAHCCALCFAGAIIYRTVVLYDCTVLYYIVLEHVSADVISREIRPNER